MPIVITTSLARIVAVVALALSVGFLRAGDSTDLKEELRQIREQNALLQKQLAQQQQTIDSLSKKVSDIQAGGINPDQHGMTEPSQTSDGMASPSSSLLGKVAISGEGGIGFFKTGSEGTSPHGEFRLDEARLFIEAQVREHVFFYSELNLATREDPDVQARVGELYLDVEDLSQIWGGDHQLNARAGRLYVPFGEEYQNRYAMDNPFISHSVSDLWGVDEGLELYGQVGQLSYVAAVQNGGIPDAHDFTEDKSVAGRIGFDASERVHLSVSGMRSGAISVRQDQLSAMWFGNGFFRSIGSAATTRFGAELVEGDVEMRFAHGHVHAFGGYIHYHDNDPSADNSREMFYYSVEAVQNITSKLYGAARFSQVMANGGYGIVGNGTFGDYLFGTLTQDLWRLSLDLGYRWNRNLLLKMEYSFEGGRTVEGEKRDNEDLFAVEAAFRF